MLPDPGTDWKLQKVCPDVAERWKQVRKSLLDSHKLQIRVTDGYRDYAEQYAIWAKGRTKDANGFWTITNRHEVITHALPGASFHNFGLAIDSCFMGEDPYLAKLPKEESDLLWQAYGDAVKAAGMEWGGDWTGDRNDRPHAQVSYGLSVHTCQMIYESSGIPGVWSRCKQTMLCGLEIV